MIYKLKNRIFGWDYIYWENTADQGVARVFTSKDGRVVYWQYPTVTILKEITFRDSVVWLTCKPEKFGL